MGVSCVRAGAVATEARQQKSHRKMDQCLSRLLGADNRSLQVQ
jgi:hypothetical protein